MPDLGRSQQLFAAALTDAAIADEALALFSGAADKVRGRLALYRGNVAGNAGKALACAYPVIRQLLGIEFFDAVAHAYANAFPSATGDLNEHGAQLALFLECFAHTRELPYLPDVARLEWLVHRAHYAADPAGFDLEGLRTASEEEYLRLAVRLHPAAAMLASPYPIGRIWEVHQRGFGGEIAVDLDSGAQKVLVYRPRFRVEVDVLEAGEAVFLSAILEGQRLGAAYERAAAEAPFDLATSLRRWVENGVVIELHTGIEALRDVP